ncbi:hypothetical protein ABT124_42485 [Streptomyces sp. NPDC001982]|uniref:hypothetical protein n=1 Tax=unclassified Streptomyces TaxID=2593676 RepID=UPI003323C43C
MNKLMRRIATVGASAVIAGGAVLAAGGSASAATPTHSPHPRPAAVVYRYDPWIADQLAAFGLEHSHEGWVKSESDHRYYPWVADQVAIFVYQVH